MRRHILFLGSGILLLATTGIIYIPKFATQGLAGIELTFLSNFASGLLLALDGILRMQKKKAVRQEFHISASGILLCVLLISVACIGEANFSGFFMFLHVFNPLLATILTIVFTYQNQIRFLPTFVGTFLFALLYLIYVILYGYQSGDWLYSIINVQEKGFPFVILFFLIICAILAGLEYGLYYCSKLLHERSAKRIS